MLFLEHIYHERCDRMDDPDSAVSSLLPSVSDLYGIFVKSYLKKTIKSLIRAIFASGYLAHYWGSTT